MEQVFQKDRFTLITDYCEDFVQDHEWRYMEEKVKVAHELIHEAQGAGHEYLGWLGLPVDDRTDELSKIQKIAHRVRGQADIFLVVGVGGSYLGARAAIDFLRDRQDKGPEIQYLGTNLSPRYMSDVLDQLEGREVYVNVISKSGGTLEPSIAFRSIRRYLEDRYGKEDARERIIATTDAEKGRLKELADREGYETLVIPDDIGGRYSIFTSVGLLPIAVAGIDIEQILAGSKDAYHRFCEPDLTNNPCYQYAAMRYMLYQKGKSIELLANYEPYAGYLAEWWKQLFGESEGKDGKGLFPARADFTTDLHSLGQYIQDGRRHLFCTTLWWEMENEPKVPALPGGVNDDGLGYLEGKSLSDINRKAFLGTLKAHTSGGVPNMVIVVPDTGPYYFGKLIYFFQKACAMSGYLLGVNPFDQPGVEAYKSNVKALLNQLT